MNVISCKLHKYAERSEEEIKKSINEKLPSDIKIFRIFEISNNFNSKHSNDNRNYHYILPTFMLEPVSLIPQEKQSKNFTIDGYNGNYDYSIPTEYHEKLKEICKLFRGTKNFHNFTKKQGFSDPKSSRHIYEMSCSEIIKFKRFQAIKFKIVGQSFLYNQIRKMIGILIELCRDQKDSVYLENSFLSNKQDTPKAPGEGLYLHKIDYSKYNDRKLDKKSSILLSENDEKEMEDFRLDIVDHIENLELEEKIFSKWLWRFDNQRENTY